MQNHMITLVGAGQMSIEYAKVLKAMNLSFRVVGNSETGTRKFHDATGIEAISGGYENFLRQTAVKPEIVIIAVDDLKLSDAAQAFCQSGAKRILVEKPAGLYIGEIDSVIDSAAKSGTSVYVGYNRRFYASVIEAQNIIINDGGVISFSFDFTEWAHVIEKTGKPTSLLSNWLVANSSHVIDLAFYLGGFPYEITSFKSGSLSWHEAGAVFSGAGTTQEGSVFSYHANWLSAGRWSLEIMTINHKLIFRPLEKLQLIKKGSVVIEEPVLDYSLDTNFKPGLFRQVQSFLSEQPSLPSIQFQKQNFSVFQKILCRSTDII